MNNTLSSSTSADSFTIYHNARCSNSRGALAILRERGVEPEIIDYIAHPLSVQQLEALIGKLGVPVREVMRTKEDLYKQLKLDADTATDAQLLEAIAAHPVLLNRPIVVHGERALLCRPPEQVLHFFEN
ncbi:arsenate reductase (glutaredoxin) [Diaphorobacter sp. NR2-3-3-1]|nr:arsenate reductase (glutaredoxin) [Diaphorobacter caeni]